MKLSSPKDLLKELVAIRSVFPDEAAISTHLAAQLRGLGFKVEEVTSAPGRVNLVGTFGNAERYLGFYGHMDTVPPASDYQRDPFTLQFEGDIARGLGAVDMKGGLVCILHAAAFAAEAGLPMKVVFGVDEEDISRGAHDLVDSGLLKDIAFLVVAESGQLNDFNLPLSVCLGRKGRIVYSAEILGKASHAAEAHKGVNAIEMAARFVSALSALEFPEHPTLGRSTLVVQKIQSESGSFSVPDHCEVQFSLLTTPNLSSASFESQANALAQEMGIQMRLMKNPRPTPYGESYEINTHHPLYRALKEHVLSPLGAAPMYTPSVADENVFANRLGIPVLTLGAIGAGDHTKDEWVKISSLDTVISVYKAALELVQQIGL